MSSKFNRVAKMGSKSSKYGEQRAACFEKGDVVTVDGLRGIVERSGRGFVHITINGITSSYNPRFVKEYTPDVE